MKYEYKHTYIALFPQTGGEDVLSALLQDELNKYASDGWELVTISESLLNLESVDGYAVFKRRK